MKKLFLLLGVAASLCACAPKDYDVCIYGGTASGIVAAKAAAAKGMNVIVIEPTCRIGGMTTGGLGRTDIGNKQVVKGLALKFYRELGAYYGNLENWFFEPKVALDVINSYADSPRIKIIKEYHMCDAVLEGTDIKSIRVAGGENNLDTLTFSAKCFIDCSYEGDLMAASGVTYRTGREDNSEFGETWDGYQMLRIYHHFPDGVDPYVVPGDPESGLLWGISNQPVHETGTGDDLIQAYNYRICLTDQSGNMLPIEKPENYDPSMYELLVRLFEAQPDKRKITDYFIWTLMPNHKTDINNKGAFSTDMIGMNYGYPDGTWEERQEIIKAHKDYTLGLLYFYQNDPRVPAELQEFVRGWGLCKDEYTECGNWTPQLYVREARRLEGEYIATQADCHNKKIAPEGIAYAAYNMDSHNTQRILIPNPKGGFMVENEGDVENHEGLPYPISYRSITPKRAECTNLLVPVCCSASHIAYGSIRMEPVFMCLGQAAGIAASLYIKEGLEKVQDVDYTKINEVFENDPYMDGTAPDILIDDPAATINGEGWTIGNVRKTAFGPSYWVGDGSNTENTAVYSGAAKVAGTYDVYSFQHRYNKKMCPVTVFDFSNGTSVSFNGEDMDIQAQSNGQWQKISEMKLAKGEEFSVTIHSDGTQGELHADAILLVKQK